MSDVIGAATDILVPALAAGSGAAVVAAGSVLGKDAAEAAHSILDRIRPWLRGEDKQHVREAVGEAVIMKEISRDELKDFLELCRRDSTPRQQASAEAVSFNNKDVTGTVVQGQNVVIHRIDGGV